MSEGRGIFWVHGLLMSQSGNNSRPPSYTR